MTVLLRGIFSTTAIFGSNSGFYNIYIWKFGAKKLVNCLRGFDILDVQTTTRQ
jgi:hypothetical protein